MKDYKLLRIWEVIYPIGIYFVVTNVVMFVLNLIHTMTNGNAITVCIRFLSERGWRENGRSATNHFICGGRRIVWRSIK